MKGSLLTILCTSAVLLLPLVLDGGQTAEEIGKDLILGTGLDWRDKYDRYDPAADMVDALKQKLGAGIKIDVYLGLWCPDSRNNVPPFIKILDSAGSAASVRYFSLPRKANKETQYFVSELKIDRVPTFIVYMEGKEIGRIVENPKVGMIEDLMEILFQ